MRFVGNSLYLFHFDRAIDLHLLEACRVVAIHPHAGLLGCVDASDAKRHGASAVDNSGEQQARAEPSILGDGITDGRDEFKFVAAIADSRDPRCEIDRSPFHLLEVGVHIPEAGQEEFSFGIDDVSVLRES